MAFNLLAKLISLGPMFFPVFIRSNNNFKIVRTFPYYIRSRQSLWGPKLNRAKNPWDRLFCLWLLIQYYNKETNLSLWVWGRGLDDSRWGGRVLFSCHNSKTKARYLSTICEGTILCQEFRKVVIGGTGAIVLNQTRTAVSKHGVIGFVFTGIC